MKQNFNLKKKLLKIINSSFLINLIKIINEKKF